MAEATEVRFRQWFGENVGNVRGSVALCNFEVPEGNKLANVVVFYSDMFDARVPHVVLCDGGCSNIVAKQGGCERGGETDSVQ
jgi:hypothetical protein